MPAGFDCGFLRESRSGRLCDRAGNAEVLRRASFAARATPLPQDDKLDVRERLRFLRMTSWDVTD